MPVLVLEMVREDAPSATAPYDRLQINRPSLVYVRGQKKLEGDYGDEGQKEEAPHFFLLPSWFFGGLFPFPLGLESAVNAAPICVFGGLWGRRGCFLLFKGWCHSGWVFCGVFLCAFVFCASCVDSVFVSVVLLLSFVGLCACPSMAIVSILV